MQRLKDKTVIVTGAAGGIGAAVTERCLNEGAVVLACDIDESGLTKVAEQISSSKLTTFRLDVSSYHDVAAFFEQLTTIHPESSCLVNNAGVYLGCSILDYSPEEMHKVMAVNINGAIYCCQLFARMVLARHGSGAIVNMSSVAGQEGSSDALYGLSKAALIGLTKSCAMNFAPHIRVNAVAPSLVETGLLKTVPDWRIAEYRQAELLKTPVLPEDVAATVAFLLADESRNYTGAVLDINNGCYRR